MDIKEFCISHQMDLGISAVSLAGGGFTLLQMQTSPMDFLSLAEDDFQCGGLSASVNATTNAKRAIVCQLDQLLTSLGYPSGRWNVPKKIQKLQTLGLLAPGILRRVVDMRNILEHEYLTPDEASVEEALDIAGLFVMSVSAMFNPFDDELQFSFYDGDNSDKPSSFLAVGLVREERGVFYKAYASESNGLDDECVGSCEIPSGHALFESMVKLSSALILKYRKEQAFLDFEATYSSL